MLYFSQNTTSRIEQFSFTRVLVFPQDGTATAALLDGEKKKKLENCPFGSAFIWKGLDELHRFCLDLGLCIFMQKLEPWQKGASKCVL